MYTPALALLVAALMATRPPLAAAGRADPAAARMLPDTLYTLDLPPALPGAVITASVQVPREVRGRGRVHFTVTASRTVRLFGSPEGAFAGESAPERIPLTFTLPRDQEAGSLRIASVRFERTDGTTVTTELRLTVSPLRRIRVSVAAATVATTARPLLVHYRVANLGNATDTIAVGVRVPAGWPAPRMPAQAILAHGDTAVGVVTVQVPRGIATEAYTVTIVAAGQADTSVENAFFRVGQDSPMGGWASLPATLFVGIPSFDGGRSVEPTAALIASGPAGPGTIMTIVARHASATPSLAFHRYTSGPELLASISRPDWRLTAGNLFVASGGALGLYAAGTGAEYAWTGASKGDVFLARPSDFGSGLLPGHLARAAVAVPTPAGAFGVRVADFERPLRAGLPSDRTQAASLSYELGSGSAHHLELEGGYGRLTPDSGRALVGPTGHVDIFVSRAAAYLTLRATHVPGVIPGNTGMDEAYVGGGLPLMAGLQALGWATKNSVPLIGVPATTHTEASAGLRAFHAGASLTIRGAYSRNGGLPVLLGGSWTEQTVTAVGGLPFGAFALDVNADVGVIQLDGGGTRPLRNTDARLSWRSAAAFAWFGVNRTQAQFGTQPVRLDLGGSAAFKGFQLDGGAGAFLSPQAGSYLGHVWGSAGVPLVHGTGALLGVEYEPWMPAGSRTRLSAGLKLDFGLPVPIPGRAAAKGVVFEDHNSDGVREPGEPALAGVGLRLGKYTTSTDDRGRFAFPSIAGMRTRPDLQLDMTSLPLGWLTEGFPAKSRDASIPLVRAGSIRIKLLAQERPGPDSVARPAPNVSIELIDRDARVRTATSDSTGTILFRALPPGRYTLTIYPVGGRGQALPTKVIPLEIPYGAMRTVIVPVPTLPVEIRFGPPSGASGKPDR